MVTLLGFDSATITATAGNSFLVPLVDVPKVSLYQDLS
jgi:hypothetical protein